MDRVNIKSGFIPELEGLRGVLASWVLAFHLATIAGAWETLPPLLRTLLDGGRAVDVFVILSGFVIGRLLLDKDEGYWPFIVRRAFRVYPVYVCCVAGALLASSWGMMPVRYTRETLVQHLLAHATMLHGAVPEWVLPHSAGAILNPAWSVSLEWQFYLVAPLLLARRWMLIAFLGSCLASRIALPHLHGFGAGFLLSGLPLFYIGIAFAVVHRMGVAVQLALAGIAACLLLAPLAAGIGPVIWFAVYVAIAWPQRGRWISAVLTRPTVLQLGRWSYPMYLCHEIVVHTVAGVLPADLPARAFLAPCTSVAVTLCTAAVLHRYVEVPAIYWARHVTERRRPLAVVTPQQG
jgi:peptidoglycan/LPS O-acetylase OafA/YrhL